MTQFDWQPGPGQGKNEDRVFEDGESLLVAVAMWGAQTRDMTKPPKPQELHYEYAVVVAKCDEDGFELELNDEYWGWEWDDVEWFVPLATIKPPPAMPDRLTADARKQELIAAGVTVL